MKLKENGIYLLLIMDYDPTHKTRLSATYMYRWNFLKFTLLCFCFRNEKSSDTHTTQSTQIGKYKFQLVLVSFCSFFRSRTKYTPRESIWVRLSVCIWFFLFCDVTRTEINVNVWRRWGYIAMAWFILTFHSFFWLDRQNTTLLTIQMELCNLRGNEQKEAKF